MTDRTRQEILLSRAREAEDQAAKAHDPVVREHWLKIAQAYRELAKSA